MGSLSSKNWGAKYFLCFRDVFINYALVKSAKDEKTKPAFSGFVGIENEFKYKPNKL